jgi:ribose-phosphate pyrophosphokinase
MSMAHDFRIVSGTANEELADLVARGLGVRLAASEVSRFPDGEISVQLLEPVRRKDVFIVQPTSPPVSEHLVELLAFVDACRRAAAARITAIVPYFGYARSDKRHARREPIGASMVAGLLESAGVDHVVTVDLHTAQIEGFFRVPVDNLTAVPTLTAALEGRLATGTVVVSPDAGRVRMATDYADALGTSVAVLHKRRRSGTETEITHVVGEVRDRACLIIDDMIATGGTLVEAIEALLAAGARPDVTIAATHGLLLGGAREKLDHPAVRAVVVTDTVAVQAGDWPKLSVVTVAPVIARAIERFVADGSLADLYVTPRNALRRPA